MKRWEELYKEHRPTPRSKAGRKLTVNPVVIVAWRQKYKATIAETAENFSVDPTTVKNACRVYGDIVRAERTRWHAARQAERDEAKAKYHAHLDYMQSERGDCFTR